MKIYHCEDSLEGIFTAIYNTYEDHCIIRDTMVTTIEENLLFSESVEVIPDPEKTIKVIRTLKRRFGEADYGDPVSGTGIAEAGEGTGGIPDYCEGTG